MALFDIFKKGRRKEKEIIPAKAKKSAEEKKPIEKKSTEIKTAKKPFVSKKSIKMAYKILESPHVTEKAGDLTEKNKYSFKVSKRSNKAEVKKAVEELYGVNVINVAIINIHRKKKRVGRTKGFRKGYKKAIVEIKKGQSIEIMPR